MGTAKSLCLNCVFHYDHSGQLPFNVGVASGKLGCARLDFHPSVDEMFLFNTGQCVAVPLKYVCSCLVGMSTRQNSCVGNGSEIISADQK